jgi:hypothetical protein
MSLQVSHEEWVSMWNDYAKNPDKALDWQNRYMNFMFDLEDSSGKIKHNLDRPLRTNMPLIGSEE